jgi:methylphosphotriester-DNA--protein-cysteine methyltransferase
VSLQELASRLATERRSLERQFLHEIGMTIAEYRTRRRVIAIVRFLRIGSPKRETLAHTIGWRSKKGVYDACERVLRKTPADIQRLSEMDASCLEARLLDPHAPVVFDA